MKEKKLFFNKIENYIEISDFCLKKMILNHTS